MKIRKVLAGALLTVSLLVLCFPASSQAESGRGQSLDKESQVNTETVGEAKNDIKEEAQETQKANAETVQKPQEDQNAEPQNHAETDKEGAKIRKSVEIKENQENIEDNAKYEEYVNIQEIFIDTSLGFSQAADRLLEEDHALSVLAGLDEITLESFLNRISDSELLELQVLYMYLWLTEAGRNLEAAEEEQILHEGLQKRLALFQNILERNIQYGGQDQAREKAEEQAFKRLKEILTNELEISEQEAASIVDLESYAVYLKHKSEANIEDFLSALNKIELAARRGVSEEEKNQVLRETEKTIYEIYGLSGFEDTEIQDSDSYGSNTNNLIGSAQKPEAGPTSRAFSAKAVPAISYRAYCQTYGWKEWGSDGAVSGTTEEQKRMEALQIRVYGHGDLGVSYQAHVQSKGWMNWVSDGETAGTQGEALRMEAFRIRLTGGKASDYDVYYRAYCQTYGWLDWAKNGQASGTINLKKRIEAVQVMLIGKGSPAPGTAREPLKTDAVARIGNTYYTDFNHAFDSLGSSGTLYVVNDCTSRHIVTTKSFTLLPEDGNRTVTYLAGSREEAGIICSDESRPGNAVWNIGGDKGYTLTMNANGSGYSGVIVSNAGNVTIHAKEGSRFTNSSGNGIWNNQGTTHVYSGSEIYGNGSNGVASCGTVNIHGGKIYRNGYDGVRAQTAINLYGGEIFDNQECGIYVGEEACTFTMTGGSIHNNRYGAANMNGRGTMNISAGNIYDNQQDGVACQGKELAITGSVMIRNNGGAGVAVNGGTALIQGGRITENKGSGIVNKGTLKMSGGEVYSNLGALNGGGVLTSGTFTMSGGSIFNNRVQKAGGGIAVLPDSVMNLSGGMIKGNTAGEGKGIHFNGAALNMSGAAQVDASNDVYLCASKFVTVTGSLNTAAAAVLTPDIYKNGRKVAQTGYGNGLGSTHFHHFKLTPGGNFILRPGDFKSDLAKVGDADIILSTQYHVRYDKNFDGAVQNMPGEAIKHWYETAKISDKLPDAGLVRFKGWSEDAKAENPKYLANGNIDAAVNRDLKLYAVWNTKIKIIYRDSEKGSSSDKVEYATLKDCTEKQGYTIRKNKGFAGFARKDSAFAGWDIYQGVSSEKVKFPENKINKVSFEEILRLAKEQQKISSSDTKPVPELVLYTSWDEFPKITAKKVLEFYEGTEVTAKMLMDGVNAADREDGDITDKVRISKIEYAPGKIVEGKKQDGAVEIWKDGMPDSYKLDTWFLQMDPKDSPVIHKIIYQVTDSFGNRTELNWTVKVIYNEFPKLEEQECYFTLEESREGVITERLLLDEGIKDGRIKATDKEDDKLYPGQLPNKIELLDFCPEEFLEFEDSGYVTVTYSVKDSMGPEGNGKETFRQCTVYVVKDGEIVEPEAAKYVRFINQEYYEENLNNSDDEDKSKNGGLLPDSKWYQDPEYKARILSVWDSDKAAAESWNFSDQDVKNVKFFVKEYGIGNSLNENALTKFSEQFSHLRKS